MRNTKKPIQLYRGTTQQHSDYAGPVGEITVDTEKYTVVVQNGVTGGVPLAREDTVVSLTNRIAAEESARATADTALQKSITDEASAREAADTTLQNNIDSEVSARETADTDIQKSVTDEVSARKAADTALQKGITDEVSAREAADTALQKGITDEVSARKAADTAIRKSVTDEASARETADNAFQKQIDNLLRRGAVIGEIRWFAMSTPPTGWLVCNGASVFKSDYPALYNAIGHTFLLEGAPTSPVMFELPYLMGKVPWGSTSVGTVIDAGAPDIAGNAVLLDNVLVNTDSARVWGDENGCFSVSGAGPRAVYTHVDVATYADNRTLTFRASKSNGIYGNSTTVQPPALCLLPCIRYE